MGWPAPDPGRNRTVEQAGACAVSDFTSAEDRCRGLLIGLAAGDQIGGPIRMAVRLAESLLDCGGFNPADILSRYLAWWSEGAFDTGPVSGRSLALMASGCLGHLASIAGARRCAAQGQGGC